MHLGPSRDQVTVTRFLKTLAKQMTNCYELEEIELFARHQKTQLDENKLAVEQALENVRINAQWQEKYYDKVSRLLEEFEKKMK